MEPGVAPSALRIPISRVRSFTDMSMMLLMPTIPAIIVPIPIIQIKMRMPLNRFTNFWKRSTVLNILKALGSSGEKLCRSAIFARTDFSMARPWFTLALPIVNM